jgi:hypothetical protein
VSLNDALSLVSEKELEIQRFLRQIKEAEEAVKQYRSRALTLEEEFSTMQQ